MSIIHIIEFRKQYMQNVSFLPTFEDELSFYKQDIFSNFNCYAYAMPFRIKGVIYDPGFIKDLKYEETSDSLMDNFINDCNQLGIKHKSCDLDNEIEKDSYKIIAMFERKNFKCYNADFHFIRQNEDGCWSEMREKNEIIRRVLNPEDDERYEIVDVFKIKK